MEAGRYYYERRKDFVRIRLRRDFVKQRPNFIEIYCKYDKSVGRTGDDFPMQLRVRI